MLKTNLLALLLALFIAGAAQAAPAHDHGDEGDATAAESATSSSDPYYFSTSPTGKALGDNPVVEVYEGRELRFADKADSAAFHKDPAKYIAALDEQIIADQS